MHRTRTQYYVTFEQEDGERHELSMLGREYGLLIEGDAGMLRWQGARYLGFTREMPSQF